MGSSHATTPSDTQADAQRNYRIGIAMAIGGAALFSLKPILIKLAYQQGIDSTTLMMLRMVFSSPLYLLIGLWLLRKPEFRTRLTWQNVTASMAIGLLGYYLAALLDLVALQYISAQLERLVLFTYPALVALLAWVIYRRKPSNTLWIALALSYGGVAIIVGKDLSSLGENVTYGMVLIFACAVVFALYMLLSKNAMKPLGSRLFTCFSMLSASVAILLQYTVVHDIADLQTVNQSALLTTVAIALFATVIPSFMIAEAVSRLTPEITSTVGSIGPIVTAFLAVWILNEPFSIGHLVALLLVISGVGLLIKNKA